MHAVPGLHMPPPHLPSLQRFVDWARSRWEHGLGGWGFPWQEGEDAWMVLGHLQSQAEAEEGQGPASSVGRRDADVPAEQLADPDSRWAESGGLRVHYKLALPLVRSAYCCGVDKGGCGRAALTTDAVLCES